MTKTLRIFLVASAVLSLQACDFLDQAPETQLDEAIVFDDVSGAEAAINGAYNRTQGPMDDFVVFSSLAADFSQHTGSFPSWTEIDTHNIPTNNVEASQQYIGWYALVDQANILIESVQGTPGLDDTRANAIQGEAYALRAFAYHNLVRWFGGVPLVLASDVDLENTDIARSSKDEVYDQIIADLRQAEGLVSASRSVGFVDRDVVRALLARVLLYDEQYDEAGVIAAEIAAKYPLVTLEALYQSLNSTESIWELQYTVDDGNSMAFFAFPSAAGGRFEYGPTPQAVAAYETGDGRIPVNFVTVGGGTRIGKYFRINNGDDHHFILRGAEMILIQAEVAARANQPAQAVALVNQIRARAGAVAVDPTTITSGNVALDLVLAERARELSYEGHRWHDLVRTGRAVNTLATLSDENFTRWPIPQRELDINSLLVQNAGY